MFPSYFRAFDLSIHNRLEMEEDHGPIKDKSTIPKDWIKQYIFNYIHDEIIEITDDINFNARRNRILNTKTIPKLN